MSETEPNDSEPSNAADTSAGDANPARFDTALAELEKLVETLEQGDLSLDDSLAHFERGVGLARECRESLQSAEQRVQILMQQDGDDADDGALDDFDPERDDQ